MRSSSARYVGSSLIAVQRAHTRRHSPRKLPLGHLRANVFDLSGEEVSPVPKVPDNYLILLGLINMTVTYFSSNRVGRRPVLNSGPGVRACGPILRSHLAGA